MTPRDWRVDELSGRLSIEGVLEISNPHPRMEVFVPELRVEPVLLGSFDPAGLELKTRIIADHPDEETREDGYWPAYIVKGRKSTRAKVSIEITGPSPSARVDSLWVDAHWLNYGPFGRLQRRQGVLVPLRRPEPLQPIKPASEKERGAVYCRCEPTCSVRWMMPLRSCAPMPLT